MRSGPGAGARAIKRLRERRTGAEHRLQAHGADDVGRDGQAQRIVVGERPDARHQLRAVEERQALLGTELDRRQPGPLEGLAAPGPGPAPSTDASPSPISTSARCASGARSPEAPRLPRDGTTGWTASLSMPIRSSARSTRTPDRPTARVLARRSEHGAHHLVGQGVADARGMRTDEVALELGRACSGSILHVGEVAEAGRNAVDGRPLGYETLDDRPGLAHPLGGVRVERHRPAARAPPR